MLKYCARYPATLKQDNNMVGMGKVIFFIYTCNERYFATQGTVQIKNCTLHIPAVCFWIWRQ